jgi:tryptophan 7-halogenase
MSAAPKHLVIVGREAPVWLSACVLQSALGAAGLAVSVVELPSRMTLADVYATLPAIEPLHTRLRIDEGKLIGAIGASFTLGKNFADTTGNAPAFFHPYGSTGSRIDKKEFLSHWVKARRLGLELGFEKFCLTAAAARHGRMLIPDLETEGLGFSDYGYHLPAIPYDLWLKQLAMRRGVQLHEARALQARLDSSGAIARLDLDGGRHVAGDFFLDVTGGEALLLGAALAVERESWRDSFVADRALIAYGPPVSPIPSYTEVRARTDGWVSMAASQACTHVLHAFSSEHTTDEAALRSAAQTARLDLRNAAVRRIEPGRRLNAWARNCVAIGDAAASFDPLHSVELQAVQIGLVHLLPLFPVGVDCTAEQAEYNQNVRSSFERLRDFQSAHYLLNQYGDSPFWTRAREASRSAQLEHKIDAFRARGDVAYYEDETFAIDDWQALLIGHGVIPETYDPAVDRTPPELVKTEFQRILRFIKLKVEEQSSLTDYLRKISALRASA